MTEHVSGERNESNSSIKPLGVMIIIISLVQLIITVLLFYQENHSFIFVITQNGVLFVSSLIFTMFSYKFDSTLQSSGNEERKVFFRYFIMVLVISFLAIIFYLITVPIPQPKFDEEGVSLFYAMLTILNVVTILNLVLYYLGLKNFRNWISVQENFEISRKMNQGIFVSVAALIVYFVANLPLLDTALKFESYANPIDPSVFTIQFSLQLL